MAKKEKEPGSLREITFYGAEVSQLLKENMKLVTLRKPNVKYDFEVGEVIEANCVDSKDRVRLVVIANSKKALSKYNQLELLLDGYDDAWQAEDDLKTYPGYQDLTQESVVQGVMTVTEELFLTIPEEMREYLLEGGVNAMLDVDQPFKEIFWPAWCRWIVAKGGGVREWRQFLMVSDLVSFDETSDKFDKWGPRKLLGILANSESPLYRSVVLMESES